MGFGSNPLGRSGKVTGGNAGFYGGFQIHGDKQLIKMFGQLPKHINRVVVRNALSAGGVPIRDGAKQNALAVKDTGLLAKSVKIKPAKKKYANSQMVTVGPVHMKTALRRTKRGKLRRVGKKGWATHIASGERTIYYDPGNYGHLVEFGTKAHVLAPKNGKAMVMPDGGVRRGRIYHYGTQGIGFMRRATDANAAKALTIVNNKLLKGMRDYIAKHPPKR